MTPSINAIGYMALNHRVERYLKTIIAKEPVKAIFHFCTFGGFAPRSCYEKEMPILFLPNRFFNFCKL